MASFHAELHLGGGTYRVVRCQYACSQDTDARGRASTKVRHHLLELTLDVPTDDTLLAWTAAPQKPQAGQVVFHDMTQLVAHETIAFTAGKCVGYTETFESGAKSEGAYVCHLTIAAPEYELRGGGLAVEAGQLAQTAMNSIQPYAMAQELVAPEAGPYNPADPATHFVRASTGTKSLSPALAAMLEHTLVVATTAQPDGPPGFEAAVKADLQTLYETPTGKALLESLHASGKRIFINYGLENAAHFPLSGWEPAFYQLDGVTPGPGTALRLSYNPFREEVGDQPWNTRPPGIGLAHELIHAEQAAYGRMRRGDALNPPGGTEAASANKLQEAHIFELETLGVPPYHTYSFSENKIRSEWNPPQTARKYY
jgi:hypothetical protein